MDELIRHYEGTLGNGYDGPDPQAALENRWASLESLRRLFDEAGRPIPSPSKPDLAGSPQERAVAESVTRAEALKARLQAELAVRDASAAMLAAAERLRAGALRERRDGKDMLEFRKDFSRLSMVMDLSYGLNLLNSAEAAIAGMQELLDQKVARIAEQRARNEASGGQAGGQAGRAEEWRKEAEAAAAEDRRQAGDFASLSSRIGSVAARVREFQNDVPALSAAIDARDKGQSAGAVQEYERRLALLPALREKLISGASEPGSVSSLSRAYLKDKSREVAGHLSQLSGARERIAEAPIEAVGVLVIAVPGIPAVSVRNPSAADVLDILARRRVHWQGLLAEQRETLRGVEKALDSGNAARVADDFGDSVPESLAVYRQEQLAIENTLKAQSDPLAALADAWAAEIEAAVGGSLPRLSGKPLSELRELLPLYADRLDAISAPDNSEAHFRAKAAKLGIARLLPFLGDFTIRRVQAEKTAKFLEKPLNEVLPKARTRFSETVSAMEAVLADIAADEAWVRAGFPPEAAALKARKTALVDRLEAMLRGLQDLLDMTLIPFQEDRIIHADPAAEGDGYAVLYKEKKNLFVKIDEAWRKTVPWGLASGGAPFGDAGAARANIAKNRLDFAEYSRLIADFIAQMRRRKDPANTETEDVYGEQAPYSLVRREAKYREEKVLRAAQFNQRAAQINDILARMDALSGSKHALAARHRLPTDIAEQDAGAVARLRDLADRRVLQDLAAEIKRIAEEAQAQAGQPNLGVGGTGEGLPTGTQPPLELSPGQQLALLGLEAVKRLVPTTGASAGDSLAEATARFLFADALVVSSRKNLTERIPVFEGFLGRAERVVDAALADLDLDVGFVSGDLSGGPAVTERKAAIFARVKDAAAEGAALFEQKAGWSAEGAATAIEAADYYDTLGEVYRSGGEALDAELKAAQEIQKALAESRRDIQEKKRTVTGWLKQLNDPHESALSRIAQDLSRIQDKTRAVLESNIERHRLKEGFDKAQKTLEETLAALGKEQEALGKLLEDVGDLARLDPALARRVAASSGPGGAWLAVGGRGPQAIAIPKSRFGSFLEQLFSSFAPDSSARDLAALRAELLKNPAALSQLLPDSKMVEVGEGADGFYLVYQTRLSTPYGLETESQVTLGNVLRLGGSNVSVIGHRFASPPSDANAPFGDQGVTVRVESLQGKNWVNYLDVTFHKFIQDIPAELGVGSQAREARLMVFDDFAVMLANGKLYLGAAGFADFALQNAADKPYYYGGNFKAKVKFTEIVSLTAEESVLFAKDPRKFLQTVNLDFTRLDPDLHRDFVIGAEGENKHYRRDKAGVSLDLQKALEGKDAFTMDFYFARVEGTDDLSQRSLGASVLKGFSFNVAGEPVKTTLSGTGEIGERYNAAGARVSFELPNQGLVLSAEGKRLGDAGTYYAELRKKLGGNSEAFLSYGSRYIGLNHRLTIGADTSFTLGELWRQVAGGAAEDLRGGTALARFNQSLEEFFKRAPAGEAALAELKRVFDADVGKKLLSLRLGELSRDIADLERAGAILDNTRLRGMVGFVAGSVGTGTAERTSGGGFQVGTQTEIVMTKSQRTLIKNKTVALFSAGLDLQERLLELSQAWQAAAAELAQSRWEEHLAFWMEANADDAVLKAQARALAAEAAARRVQARLRYNALTGRGPDEAAFLEELAPADIEALFNILGEALEAPERLSALIGGLRGALDVPAETLNLMDWIPFIERFTFTVGVQLQDILANQVIGAAFSVRLPVYDPASGYADKALRLEDVAVISEMAARLRNLRLRARRERLEADALRRQARLLHAQGPELREALVAAIRGYRNGLARQDELWGAMRRWHWAASRESRAYARGALVEAWALLDEAVSEDASSPLPVGAPPSTLAQAYETLEGGQDTLEALAKRSQAAAELLEAASHRIQKVHVDVHAGLNLTAAGVAWIPAFGITGLAVYPVVSVTLQTEELKQLSMERRRGETQLYARLGDKARADLELSLFEAYVSWRAAREAGQDDEAAQLKAALNHLLGRPLDDEISLSDEPEAAFEILRGRLNTLDPAAANRDALASRVAVARAVEQAVDKNLRVEAIRFDPVSLVGRSLGRLVAALSGEGAASPELMALARHQTLEAERDLAAFERGLPALRARVSFELRNAEGRLRALAASREPAARAEAALLRGQVWRLKARLASLGGSPDPAAAGGLPGSLAELQERLEAAFLAESPSENLAEGAGAVLPSEPLAEAHGYLRWFNHRETLAREPVGRHYLEGWIEARLRSAATPPEALVALARLQEEKADGLRSAEAARARARAALLVSRLRLLSSAARWGASGAKEAFERAAAEAAAHLGVELSPEAIAALLPLDEAEDLDRAARRYLEEARVLDEAQLKRQLFPDGVPDAAAAPLLQLKADLVAERMSYKGFTPVAAFGLFQGRWTGGVFLEAPDPEKITKTLRGLLNDALRRELESQDRLKALSLLLHSLMASVSGKARTLEALRLRLAAARRNLLGVVERRVGPKELAAAQAEVLTAHEELAETLYALRADFVRLAVELEAVGYESPAGAARPVLGRAAEPTTPEAARDELSSYWAERLLDGDFERRQELLLSGVSAGLRARLRERVRLYREAREDALALLHKDFASGERLALLLQNDMMGKKKGLEEALREVLGELSSSDPSLGRSWSELMAFLRADAESSAAGAREEMLRGASLSSAMNGAYWEALKPPPAVLAARLRLESLSAAASEKRREALRFYLEKRLRPEDFVLKDKALDAYVSSLEALDEAAAEILSAPALREDPRWARALDATYALRESLERRRRALSRGRGLATLDAAVELSALRLKALDFEGASRAELTAASEALGELKAMRERWLGRPEDIPALYRVRGPRRDAWITESDFEAARTAGRVYESGGKRWLLPETYAGRRPATEEEAKRAGAWEIEAGLDAMKREKRRALEARERFERKEVVEEALKTGEFALTDREGRLLGMLTLQEVRRLEEKGRVFYFDAVPDRSGLRRPVHPLAARWRSPKDLLMLVLTSTEESPARGLFPSLEALEASSWSARFQRLQVGVKGLHALIAEASREELRARRPGWLRLKLESYAFALDAKGDIAAVYMDEKELEQARKNPEKDWRFFLSRELRLGVDADGLLLAVEGPGLSLRLSPGTPTRWLDGELWGAQLDSEGRIRRSYSSSADLERASRGWWLEDREGNLWKQTDKDISPTHRLKRFVDPETGLGVALGRPALDKRAKGAAGELGAVERWAYMPWNWPNILLETPRGLVKTPIELLTGRDPNQEGYIGRAYMYRTEGGATVRRGPLEKAIYFFDIFEILPDPVERFFDPSQFPSRVDNDGRILPWEWEHEKDARTVDGRKNIHFGKGSLLRSVAWAREDLEAARGGILSAFRGGVRRGFVETVRGRSGEYAETSHDANSGRAGVEESLARMGERIGADGKGRLSASPGRAAVERIAVDVEVSLGAQQHEARRRVYEQYLKDLAGSAPEAGPAVETISLGDGARQALREAIESTRPRPVLPGYPTAPVLFARALPLR